MDETATGTNEGTARRDLVRHRVRVGAVGSPKSDEGRARTEDAARRIVDNLDTTWCVIGHDGLSYTIDWIGPREVDLDFLRPDVLPPDRV